MSNSVFSSKYLLDNLGKENNSGDANGVSNAKNTDPNNVSDSHGSFILSSTLPSVPTVEKKVEDSILEDKTEKKANDDQKMTNEKIESDVSSDLDTDSISDGLIMTPNDEKITPVKSKTLQLLRLLNTSNLLKSRDLLLASYYEEHRYDLIKPKKLILRVITWNLNQMKPPNVKELAGESGREWASFFYAGDETVSAENKEGLADIYSINFQETISLKSFSKSKNAIDEWVDFLLQVLNAISSEKYKLVHSSGLLALTSILICKSSLSSDVSDNRDGQIHNIRENTLGLGYLRWANKGCISLRFRLGGIGIDLYNNYRAQLAKTTKVEKETQHLYNFDELDETVGKLPGVEVQILNVHLVHGENAGQVQQRWDSWAKIERKIGLDDRSVKLAFDPSVVQKKDPVQIRLEQRLHASINSGSNIDHSNYDSYFEQEISNLNLNDDLPRTSSVPLTFSTIEKRKFEGIISSVDISKLKNVTEANKALVVCGDTNYRFSLPTSAQSTVEQLVNNNSWEELLKYDQLKQEMKNKKVFLGFQEPQINFAPTFKIVNNSNGKWVKYTNISNKNNENDENVQKTKEDLFYLPRYDPKRLSAYTDRILHVEKPFFENIKGTYSSVTTKGSDHLPVAASYVVDAPLVDEDKLYTLRTNFNKQWDEVINTLVFFEIAGTVQVEHTMISRAIDDVPTKPLIENIQLKGGSLEVSCIVGETLEITFDIKNISDELFNLVVKEQTSRGWFGTKILVDCKQKNDQERRHATKSSLLDLQPKSDGEIELILTPMASGLLERTFTFEIPDYKVCPAYIQYLAVSIKVEDIFGTSFESISEKQFSNIQQCFDFILTNSPNFLVNTMEKLVNTENLTSLGWDLVREVSLWAFDKLKYEKLNVSGANSVKTNVGSITVITFLYLWLKSQSATFNTTTKRGKTIFANVLNLIKYFKMDVTSAYDMFGWLFTDEYELNSYLDRDFDIKLEL